MWSEEYNHITDLHSENEGDSWEWCHGGTSFGSTKSLLEDGSLKKFFVDPTGSVKNLFLNGSSSFLKYKLKYQCVKQVHDHINTVGFSPLIVSLF